MLLPGFQKALKRTASLLPLMPKAHPMYRGNPAITILRIFLWLIPAIVIPVVAYLGGAVTEYLRIPVSISLMLMLLIVVAATAGIGLFEELLTFQQMREPPANPKRELVVSVIVFVSLQVVIAPVVCIGAALVIGTFWP
jgi:hypothetical protein